MYAYRCSCSYQRTARWDNGRSTLTVDAFSSGNELRYVNDYRDDLDYYSDMNKQTRRPNVEAVRLYLRIEEDRRTAFAHRGR